MLLASVEAAKLFSLLHARSPTEASPFATINGYLIEQVESDNPKENAQAAYRWLQGRLASLESGNKLRLALMWLTYPEELRLTVGLCRPFAIWYIEKRYGEVEKEIELEKRRSPDCCDRVERVYSYLSQLQATECKKGDQMELQELRSQLDIDKVADIELAFSELVNVDATPEEQFAASIPIHFIEKEEVLHLLTGLAELSEEKLGERSKSAIMNTFDNHLIPSCRYLLAHFGSVFSEINDMENYQRFKRLHLVEGFDFSEYFRLWSLFNVCRTLSLGDRLVQVQLEHLYPKVMAGEV